MKVLQLKRGKVVLYDSIKEMPIDLFAAFQKYLIQDLGIGSTVEDVQKRLGTLYKYLGAKMIPEAGQESANLFQSIFLAINKVTIRHICFACWVHSIDDVEVTDYSESNLLRVRDQLGRIGVTQGMVNEILEDLKKKLTEN